LYTIWPKNKKKPKKPKFGLFRFLRFFKKPKKSRFFSEPFSSPDLKWNQQSEFHAKIYVASMQSQTKRLQNCCDVCCRLFDGQSVNIVRVIKPPKSNDNWKQHDANVATVHIVVSSIIIVVVIDVVFWEPVLFWLLSIQKH